MMEAAGDTRSAWTSWTESQAVASDFALNGTNKGVVLRQSFPQSNLVPSPNRFGEAEWLIRGRVEGAATSVVTPARPIPEW
jgi:hypothetical protein